MRKANQELTKMEVVQRRLNKVETEAAQKNIAEQKRPNWSNFYV